MVRVLHLLSSTPDFQTERTAAALARHAGTEFSITSRTIGRGGDYRNWAFASLALRKQASEFDVIHAFDFPALKSSAGSGKVLFSPASLPDRHSIRWLQTHAGKAPVEIVCSSSAEQRIYGEYGITAEHCRAILPGIEPSRKESGRDSNLRAALGFSDEDQVFLLPGESDSRSGHRAALWTISILHVLYPTCRALLWGRGDGTEPLARLSDKLHQPKLLTIADRKLGRCIAFEELLRAADTVLFSPSGPTPMLPLALCMSAGLPIVSTASPWVRDLLEDGRNAVLVPRATPRMLAQRIVELRGDPSLAVSIASGAHDDAKERFADERFMTEYLDLYQKIAARTSSRLAAV